MSKLAWVKWCPEKFLGQIPGMTMKEVGVYVTILNLVLEADGPIKDDRVRLARRCGMPLPQFEKTLMALCDDGKLTVWAEKITCELAVDLLTITAERRTPIPTEIKNAVFARDGLKCVYCETTDGPFEIDHRTPWSLGGPHTVENLCVACRDCNRSKRAQTAEEFIR